MEKFVESNGEDNKRRKGSSAFTVLPAKKVPTPKAIKTGGVTGLAAQKKKDKHEIANKTELIKVFNGKRQKYQYNENAQLGARNNQSKLYICQGLEDTKEYVLKIYSSNMIDEDMLRKILSFLEKNPYPHVTCLVEYGCTDKGCYYVIMKRYEEIDRELYKWKNTDNEVYRNRIVSFVEQMNKAMEFLHTHQFYHGDIKVDNIMVDPTTDALVLIDFGGAVRTEKFGRSAILSANTPRYTAPEALSGEKISTYSDYFSLGASLAEFIDGGPPGHRSDIIERFKKVRQVNYSYVPESLPKYYMNLIKGLLFASGNDDEIKSYRWGTKEVDEWLAYMKKGEYSKAASCNKVPEVRLESAERSALDFGAVVRLSREGEKSDFSFSNLNEMADTFILNWDEGRDIIQRKMNSFRVIKRDLYEIIYEVHEKMINVTSSTGHSAQAEYFKFLYKYISDKTRFHWGDLPGIETKEQFAARLLQMLEERKAAEYDFTGWWRKMSDGVRDLPATFVEIFRNKVFSYYLRAAGENDSSLLAQCEKVERIFQKDDGRYTYEEMSEVYFLAYKIMKKTKYRLPSGQIIETYQEFLEEVKSMAYNPERVYEVQEIMNAVKRNGEYLPDFLAWKRLQEETA